jgi:glutathione peroxidase
LKTILIVVAALIVLGAAASVFVLRGALAGGRAEPTTATPGTLWDLETTALDGSAVALGDHSGKVALVVNVASKCGLTPQYKGLEALYRERRDEGFVILGFPSNDFMGQEPGSAHEIRMFCTEKYDVTFPLMAKSPVTGDGMNNVYRWLTSGGLEEPSWNFTKFLVGRDGRVIARFGPRTAPDDEQLTAAVAAALAE